MTDDDRIGMRVGFMLLYGLVTALGVFLPAYKYGPTQAVVTVLQVGMVFSLTTIMIFAWVYTRKE